MLCTKVYFSKHMGGESIVRVSQTAQGFTSLQHYKTMDTIVRVWNIMRVSIVRILSGLLYALFTIQSMKWRDCNVPIRQ